MKNIQTIPFLNLKSENSPYSELILGSIDKEGKVILVHPSQESKNGLPIA